MSSSLTKKLYFARNKLLIQTGLIKGDILPIEDEMYQRLDNVYFAGIPISLYLKYLKPLPGKPGQCYERSLWMTMGLPGSILVRGNNKDLEFRYSKEDARHGWVEKDGWVYEPYRLCKIKRELYYKLYEPTDITSYPPEEYTTAPLYQDMVSTTLADLMSGGRKRHELFMTIPLIRGIAELSPDPNFLQRLNRHLTAIGYYDLEAVNYPTTASVDSNSSTRK